MENKRYIILISVIVLMIIIIGVIYIKLSRNNLKDARNNENINSLSQGEHFIEFRGGTIELAQENDYYTINNYMSNFFNSLVFEDPKTAFQIIDKEYAQEKNINEGNIITKLKFSDKYQKYEAIEISYIDLNEDKRIYIVYGEILEKASNTGKKEKIDALIYVDFSNATFSIRPYKSGELNKEELDTNKLLEEFISISKNENNAFAISQTNEKMKVLKLFEKYIWESLYYTDIAYNSLDEEYKQKRFNSLEKYKNYIEENKNFIQLLAVNSYEAIKKEGYTEYRIMDNYGNMYIFNVTKLLNYTVKLDDYTIETEEFINKYNSASIQNKVSLNIGKFFSMLNAKDYDSAYACLADGFKQNYFPTVDHFKKYVENNFFKSNKLEGVSFENEGETYMLTVKISDYRGRDSKTIEKTIIMQLREGTDFVMSFNVE